jgi:hypothetical protein|nr:MAG TPA: hypothetical protein [Caudoviricetes sp.]
MKDRIDMDAVYIMDRLYKAMDAMEGALEIADDECADAEEVEVFMKLMDAMLYAMEPADPKKADKAIEALSKRVYRHYED